MEKAPPFTLNIQEKQQTTYKIHNQIELNTSSDGSATEKQADNDDDQAADQDKLDFFNKILPKLEIKQGQENISRGQQYSITNDGLEAVAQSYDNPNTRGNILAGIYKKN